MKREEKYTQLFHDLYERYAPDYEYITREDTKKLDLNSPNGKLMLKVVSEVIKQIDDDFKNKLKKHIYNEHIHFDESDTWQFEDGRPYVDSVELESFINNI